MGIDRRGLARVVWGRSHPNPEIVSTRTLAPDGTLGSIEIVNEQEQMIAVARSKVSSKALAGGRTQNLEVAHADDIVLL